MTRVVTGDGDSTHVHRLLDSISCDEMRVVNNTVYLLFPDRVVKLAPSTGDEFFYLLVDRRDSSGELYETGRKIWPYHRDRAIGAWMARVCGYDVLVCKTGQGEKHYSLD